MQGIITIVLFIAPILFALLNQSLFVSFLFLSNGIPTGIISQGRSYLQVFEGMGPGGIKVFGAMSGALLLLAIKSRSWLTYSFYYPFHIFFLVFCALSLMWAPDIIFGLRMLAKLIAPIMFLYVAHVIISEKQTVQIFENSILAGCFLLLFFALLNYFTGFSGDLLADEFRKKSMLTAPFASPAPFSFNMACAALLSLSTYLVGKKKRFLLYYASFSFACLWAFTRISIAGLIIGSCILIILLANSKLYKIILPLVLCIFTLIAFFSYDRLKERTFRDADNVSLSKVLENPETLKRSLHTSGRSKIWGMALDKFFYDSPIMGSGIGATQEWFYGHYRGDNQSRTGVLHSEYLRIICEVGILGLSLFLIAIMQYAVMLINVLKKFRTVHNPKGLIKIKYSALSLSALCFYMITFCTDNSIDYIMQLGLYVFLFIGFALGRDNEKVD